MLGSSGSGDNPRSKMELPSRRRLRVGYPTRPTASPAREATPAACHGRGRLRLATGSGRTAVNGVRRLKVADRRAVFFRLSRRLRVRAIAFILGWDGTAAPKVGSRCVRRRLPPTWGRSEWRGSGAGPARTFWTGILTLYQTDWERRPSPGRARRRVKFHYGRRASVGGSTIRRSW